MRYTISVDPSLDGEPERIVVQDGDLVAGETTWLAYVVAGAIEVGALAVPAGPGGAEPVAWDRPDLIVGWLLDQADDTTTVTLLYDRRQGSAQPDGAVV